MAGTLSSARTRRARALVAAGAVAAALLAPAPAGAAIQTPAWRPVSAVPVTGLTSTWRLSLLRIRSMSAIPHVTWRGARGKNLYQFYRMFVLTVRVTNTGARPVDPYDDLALVLKVMAPYPTAYIPGWAQLPRTTVFSAMYRQAARLYGGAVPWVALPPRATATYSYVIAANRGDAHYGLYNALPYRRRVFLLSTGL